MIITFSRGVQNQQNYHDSVLLLCFYFLIGHGQFMTASKVKVKVCQSSAGFRHI